MIKRSYWGKMFLLLQVKEGHWFVLDFEAVKRVKIGRRTARSRLN